MMSLIQQLWRRVQMSIGRGRITVVDDTGAVQLAQARMSQTEVIDDMPRVGQYGFASNPPAGTECVALFVAGDRSNGVVIATNNQQYRMRALESGEVAISDDKGQRVYLTKDGIVVTSPLGIVFDTPVARFTGDVVADGDIADQGGAKSMAGMRAAHNAHKHGTSPGPDTPM